VKEGMNQEKAKALLPGTPLNFDGIHGASKGPVEFIRFATETDMPRTSHPGIVFDNHSRALDMRGRLELVVRYENREQIFSSFHFL
jgi:hypothetical protein